MSKDIDIKCSHCGDAITTPLVIHRTKKRGYGYCSRECAASAKKKPNYYERRAWANMQSRCNNPNTPGFNNYGGRGIKVLYENFDAFIRDVGPRPSPNHSLDAPGNCRWATHVLQMRNMRCNRLVTLNGETRTVADWATVSEVKVNTILYRLYRGWPHYEAVFTTNNKRGERPFL